MRSETRNRKNLVQRYEHRLVASASLDVQNTRKVCVHTEPGAATRGLPRTTSGILCYLSLGCHFWPNNLCGNSPPREQKKIVRHERTRYRFAVKRGLLAAGQILTPTPALPALPIEGRKAEAGSFPVLPPRGSLPRLPGTPPGVRRSVVTVAPRPRWALALRRAREVPVSAPSHCRLSATCRRGPGRFDPRPGPPQIRGKDT